MRPALAVDVLRRLHDVELTLLFRHGQVVITTVEAAEDNLATRIYDVTPLVNQVQYDSIITLINTHRREYTTKHIDQRATLAQHNLS